MTASSSSPQNPLNLTGHHVLVTGSASGIGRATSLMLARLGARLALVDRDESGLASVLGEVCVASEKSGLAEDGHSIHPADLEEVGGIGALVAKVVDEHGRLDDLVHCAGIQSIMPIRTLNLDTARRIMAVNAEAALAFGKAMASKRVSAGNGGSVVFISSVMGMVGAAGAIPYSMSKAAVDGLARSLALELAPRNIRVNCVAPGFVQTPLFARTEQLWDEAQKRAVEDLHPLGFGQPEDIAHAVAFLLAETGRWITGTALVVDGGYLAR